MASEKKITIEAKSADEAWYPCGLKFKGDQVLVHFLDYDSDEDEAWDLKSLETRTDVSNRVRVTSEQLQDQDCANLSVGTRVCALKELDEEQKYFDATILQINRQKHVKTENGEEECKCKFTVQWEGGPAKSEIGDLDCCAITMLCDRDPEEHPQLRRLLRKVTGVAQSSKASAPGKRKTVSRRASNSTTKKCKSAVNLSNEVKDQSYLQPLTGKKAWVTATTQMTEKEIFSTINEVCDAYQPKNNDTDLRPPPKETSEDERQRRQTVWSATAQVEAGGEPPQNDQGNRAANLPIIPSGLVDMSEPCRGEVSSQYDCCKQTANTGVHQAPAKHSSLADPSGSQGPTEGLGVNGCATCISGSLAEHAAALAQEVVLISDDDEDDVSHAQRSPQRSACELKVARNVFEGHYSRIFEGGANTSEEKQGLSDKQKICCGMWPVDCILRLDNVEKNLCPQFARTFLSAMLQDVISVFLLPANGHATCGFGFVTFKDRQAADNALRLVTSKCIVASQRQRPWSVSRAKGTDEEKELIAFTARGTRNLCQPVLKNIEAAASASRESSHQTAELRWVLPEMKEYKLVRELLELHSAHRKQLQASWKTFNREEAERRLQLAS